MSKLSVLCFALCATTLVNGIYPDDHWSYSTQLTEENVDAFVKDNVDAGKTVFVRWIASAG